MDLILDRIYALPEISRERLKSFITEVNYPKNHILLRADKVEKNIFFIKKGIARAYSKNTDNDVTFWFGKEGDPVISMKCYVANQKGYGYINLGYRFQPLGNGFMFRLNWTPVISSTGFLAQNFGVSAGYSF